MVRKLFLLVIDMERILKNKYLIFSITCILLAIILMILYINAVNQVTDKIIAIVDVEEDIDIADDLASSLDDSFSSFNIDAMAFDCEIHRENVVSEAALHQIYGSYFRDNNINIFKGRYLNYNYDKEDKAVLICDKLAFMLFGTYNCIGEEVNINGGSYIICGITESPEVKYQFSKYNVYIPLSTMNKDTILLVSAAFSGTGIQSAKKVGISVSEYGEYEIYNSNIFKLRKKFWIYLIICTYMIIFVIIIIKWLKLWGIMLWEKTKRLLLSKYFSDIYLWFVFRCVSLIITAISIIVLLFFSFGKLYSCAWSYGEYIPKSLLKWEYYREVIMKIRIDSNMGEPIKTFLQIHLDSLNLYIYSIIILLCLSLILYILWEKRRFLKSIVKEKSGNES